MEEETKDERPFYMTYDNKKNRWILCITDPKTNAVTEKKVFQSGMWRKLEERNVRR